MKGFLPLLVALGVTFGAPGARACGMNLNQADPLLPLDHAQDVPLNAVLISSATEKPPLYQLRRLDSDHMGAAGGPATSVPGESGEGGSSTSRWS